MKFYYTFDERYPVLCEERDPVEGNAWANVADIPRPLVLRLRKAEKELQLVSGTICKLIEKENAEYDRLHPRPRISDYTGVTSA